MSVGVTIELLRYLTVLVVILHGRCGWVGDQKPLGIRALSIFRESDLSIVITDRDHDQIISDLAPVRQSITLSGFSFFTASQRGNPRQYSLGAIVSPGIDYSHYPGCYPIPSGPGALPNDS